MIFIYLLIYMFFAIADLVPIYKNRQWRLLVTYTAMLLAGYTILVLIVKDVKIPSPSVFIKNIVLDIIG